MKYYEYNFNNAINVLALLIKLKKDKVINNLDELSDLKFIYKNTSDSKLLFRKLFTDAKAISTDYNNTDKVHSLYKHMNYRLQKELDNNEDIDFPLYISALILLISSYDCQDGNKPDRFNFYFDLNGKEYSSFINFINTFNVWNENKSHIMLNWRLGKKDRALKAYSNIDYSSINMKRFKDEFEYFNFVNVKNKYPVIIFKFNDDNRYYLFDTEECNFAYFGNQETLNELFKYYLDKYISQDRISSRLRQNTLFDLQQLWSVQAKKDLCNNKDLLAPKNQDLMSLLSELIDFMDKQNNISISLTYQEMADFYYEYVIDHKLTSKTRNVQQWLLLSGVHNKNDKFKDILANQNFQLLENNFELLSSQCDEFKEMKKQIFQSKYISPNVKLDKIYKIKNGFNIHKKQCKNVIRCIHGTKDISVISILLNGFLSAKELDKRHYNYTYTASGLGDGTYFARLTQASKAINYTHRYLFICDIVYDTAEIVTSYNSNLQTTKDIVIGDKVGSHNIDEILVKSPKNIYFKYLIAIDKDND